MDLSDYESDEGASPSVSDSDASSVSSRCSSPGALKIVCGPPFSPTKRGSSVMNTKNTSKNSEGASLSVRQSRKKNNETPNTKGNQKGQKTPSATPSKSSKQVQRLPRKRKRVIEESPNSKPQCAPVASTSKSTNTRYKKHNRMNQRRRTKSERNNRAGKAPRIPAVEETVVLDAEIDKFLEDKAMKNNLTATNVKSIIHHVITNNMVQKMVMSTVKQKSGNPDDSSEEEAYFEPKLTRARTKLLLENQTSPLWPIVASPIKAMKKPIMSETHALIHEELPEDSSGDEEYLPRGDETHSDDENSSIASSHASDAGSPRISTPVSSTRSKDALNRTGGTPTDKTSLFKTPPPLKPKCVRRIGIAINDSAIGRRTRSKLPLNDTALEDLEMQLIPPDITPDMYDWGLSDNEDYLAFVKDFLCPGQNSVNNEAGDDDEADPEYNVMEDEEEHDKEELRMDRAVKVSKKELNELVAELLEESHFTSGEEFDETDYGTFYTPQPMAPVTAVGISNLVAEVDSQTSPDLDRNSDITPVSKVVEEKANTPMTSTSHQNTEEPLTQPDLIAPTEIDMTELAETKSIDSRSTEGVVEKKVPVLETIQESDVRDPATTNFNEVLQTSVLEFPQPVGEALSLEPVCWFTESTLSILHHQLRQHIQLLAQTYVLTASIELPYFKEIAKVSKGLILEINNFSIVNKDNSNFRVTNLNPAWQLVNSWPHKSSTRTPIKKKILEEKYINDYQILRTDDSCNQFQPTFFPRHVVKVIAESPAFCYPELLPIYYNQNAQSKSCFTPSEDALLIYGLEDLKHCDFKIHEKTKLISQVLLPAKLPGIIYQRIRNLRKSRSRCMGASATKKYFESGQIPTGASMPSSDTLITLPPIAQPTEKLPAMWKPLISKLCTLSELNWKSDSNLVTANGQKPKKSRKKKTTVKPKQSPSTKQKIKEFVITSTFPAGMEMVQKRIAQYPDLTAFPLMGSNGDPGAYMFIPKYALPATGYNNSPTGTEANEYRKHYHTIPLNQPKQGSDSSIDEEQNNPTLSFIPVGKPFRLNGIDSDIISLASLDTPLKRPIMEHVQEVTPKKFQYECEEQSARTFGNYIPGSLKNIENEDDQCIISSDNESTSRFVDGDEDVSLTEYEENLSPESPGEGIITIEIHEDTINDEEVSGSFEIQEAGDSEKNGHSKKQDNKENSSSSSSRTGNSSRCEESVTQNTNQKQSVNGKENDDDGEDDEFPRSKRVLPEDASEDVEMEEDTEEEPEVAHSSKSKSTAHLSNRNRVSMSKRNPTKYKRSPGLSPPKKRTPKTTPVEKMLEEDKDRDEEVCDAFMHSFILKVQTVTEGRNPGLHNEFVKLISEAGDIESQVELISRVQSLLKDYPELVAEFTTFVDVDMDKSVPADETNFSDYQEVQARINFIRHLEKFTVNSPQLKAKILHKFKILKEEPDLSEKDVADGLAPFFLGNVVMMDAFKALFPLIYRPESITDPNDFEEVDMELDDHTVQDDSNTEFVKLPEEKNIPATNTCSCECHDTGTHAYSSRVKHCNKCCIKDGKVFVHNGRIIRPVNVELKSPTSAQKILSVKSCRNCIQEPNKTKESPTTRSKDDSVVTKAKLDDTETLTTSICEEEDIEEGEIVEDLDEKDQQNTYHAQPVLPLVNQPSEDKSCETKVTLRPWQIEEDRVILTTCQSQPTLEDSFEILSSLLPHRDITEIESRCVELISLLQQSMESAPATEENVISGS